MQPEWDVVIVGGGPSGLSAALVLGRCRRKTLVCDTGHPRNAASKAMHGFLTRDGINPLEFLSIGRGDLTKYPDVEFRSAEVTRADRLENAFRLELGDGTHLNTRILLLATGLIDQLPDLQGIHRYYGTSVHHCPYCDGWEHRDQRLAVYGNRREVCEYARELLCWSRDVVICSDGPCQLDCESRKKLDCARIAVCEKRIKSLEGNDAALECIRFEDDSVLERDALFFLPEQMQRSPLPQALGCNFDETGAVECSECTATNVPGLYVIGNASHGLQLVVFAAAEGTRAALAINEALLEADLSKAEEATSAYS